MAEGTPKVIVAEDNIRDLEYLVGSLDGLDCQTAARGDEALELFRAIPDACIITDLQLPGLTGVELSEAAWELAPEARIILWSQYDDEVYLRALKQCVPDDALYGYVLKNNPLKVLRRAVQTVFFEGQCWIDPQVRPVRARERTSGETISNAEFEVLIDIALGLTDQLIAQRRFLSRRGVQSRLQSLYRKFGLDGGSSDDGLNRRSRAVAIALARGLINPFELDKAERDFKAWRTKLKR